MQEDSQLNIRQLQELVLHLLRTPQYAGYEVAALPTDEGQLRQLYRDLTTVWKPQDMPFEYWDIQDSYLSAETQERGVLTWQQLPDLPHELLQKIGSDRFKVWLGDICRLQVDAIVNAGNQQLLGCFTPGHLCVDNAIHSAAGLQLRKECNDLMQGQLAPVGSAIITSAYNLLSKKVIHAVGPRIEGPLSDQDHTQLAQAYRSCLRLADEAGLASIALCAISTGAFNFPQHNAAHIAVDTVRTYIQETGSALNVIFNVYNEQAYQDYMHALDEPVTYQAN